MPALKGLQSLRRESNIRGRKILANRCLQARETMASFQNQVGGGIEQLGLDLHYITIRQTWGPLYVDFHWHFFVCYYRQMEPRDWMSCETTVALMAVERVLESQ